MSGWRLLGVAAIPLLPAIVASRSRPSALAEGSTTASRRIAESSELLLIAFTPFVATLTLTFAQYEPLLWPILLWLAVLLAATRFTVRPLLRVATRAQLQRDLVVAAMEAERARLAADLHDDALQDLTLLVRRLDAAGDEEGAAQARADRRSTARDLRRPAPAHPRRPRRRAGPRLAGPAHRAAGRRRGPPRALGGGAAAGRHRAGRLPRRPGGPGQRRQARPAADRRALPVDADRRLAVDRRCGTGYRRRRPRAGHGRWPLRAAQHAAAGRGHRGHPRRPALAGGGTHVALEWRAG